MTKKEIYEQIVQLTSELHATNVAEKIFSAAQEGDPKKVEEVFETFKKQNMDFYIRIVNFGAQVRIVSKGEPIDVFSSEEDKKYGSYVLDTNVINAESLYTLILLAKIDEYFLFNWGTESSDNFVKAIEKQGYKELSNFIEDWSVFDHVGEYLTYKSIYECLVAIFKGKFE